MSSRSEKELSKTEEKRSMFFTKDGKTYYGRESMLLGDFTLKVIGDMKLARERSAGHWVCSCATPDSSDENSTRFIVLNINCFGSKQRFIDSLREAYGGGTFLLGPEVTGTTIQLYAAYLKDDLQRKEKKNVILEPKFMGYQGHKYWLVSNKLQVENGKILKHIDHKYMVLDEYLSAFQLEINKPLLESFDYLKSSIARYFVLAGGFGKNAAPFRLATAFIVSRIIRNALNPKEVWNESSVGMIFSKSKCVGKSLSLYLLALGQGVPERVHLMFLSGGNQLLCGTSTKKMQESHASTTGVVMIDDPEISKPFCEFLLQVQGRLMSGSKKEGMSHPKAATLISSNSPELARILGRVVRFNYLETDDSDPHDETQLKEFVKFMEENKGILLAWVIRYFTLWEQVYEDANTVIEKVLNGLLKHLKLQPRWIKGVSSIIIANLLLRLSCGKRPRTCEYVLFTCQEITSTETVGPSTMQKLERNVVDKITKQTDPILTWLHPSVAVNDVAGNKVPAIAIMTSVVDAFPDISYTEFKEEQGKQIEDPSSIGVYFNKNGDGTLDDMIKRRGTCQRRAYRIPKSAFSSRTRHFIEFAGSTREDQPDESDEEEREDSAYRLVLSSEDIEAIEALENALQVQMEAWESNRDDDVEDQTTEFEEVSIDNYDYSFTDKLTPNTKLHFKNLTPQKRKTFAWAMEVGKKIFKAEPAKDFDNETNDTEVTTPVGDDNLGEPSSRGIVDGIGDKLSKVKKTLFAEGTIGVLPRPVPEASTTNDEGSYKWCSCKQERDSDQENSMILCETEHPEKCPGNTWYHLKCLGLKGIPKGHWFCTSCKPVSARRAQKGKL